MTYIISIKHNNSESVDIINAINDELHSVLYKLEKRKVLSDTLMYQLNGQYGHNIAAYTLLVDSRILKHTDYRYDSTHIKKAIRKFEIEKMLNNE